MFRKPPPPTISQHLKHGGRRKREHHDFGDIIGGIGKLIGFNPDNPLQQMAMQFAPMLMGLKKGGRARRNKKK